MSIAAAKGATDLNRMGSYPPTQAQLNAMTAEAARLAISWGWNESDIDKNVWTHAEAGSDYVSASDMMDGRVKVIRKALERDGFTDTGIMSYSVKYASSFYGPFRDAASSSPEHGDRKSHQMDIRSGYKEAILEAKSDEKEGADIIMVKPAMTYLDVVRRVTDSVSRPVAVYNVSGEYSMVMNSTEEGAQRKAMVQEIFHSFSRAGADVIVSYHTREAIHGKWFD